MQILKLPSRLMSGLLIVITAGTLLACGADASDKELVESAKSYMSEKQIRAASIELKNALQANPDNAEARYLLGVVNLQVGDLKAAEKEFQRALEMGWSAEAATIKKLRAMIAQRKFKDVLANSTTTAGWSDTSKANLLAIKARANVAEADLINAKNIFLSAERLDANAYDVLITDITLQLSEKNRKGTEAAIDKALGLFPDDPELMLISANFAVLNKQNEKAVRAFEKIIESGPDNIMTNNVRRAHLGVLKLAVLSKDFKRVQELRDELKARKIDDPEANYFLALAAYEEKDFDQAEAYLQKILKISATHGPTLLLSGSVSYAKQDFEKAAYYLSKYVVNNPENTKARKLLGRAYLALGQNDEAQTEFNAAMNDNDDDAAELTALTGVAELNSGHVQLGIIELEKALVMAPDSNELKLQLAKAYVIGGQVDNAIKLLDEVLQSDDNSNLVRKIKVLAYLQGRDIEMAMNTARQMLAKSPGDPDVLSLMGNVQLVAGDITEARKYFNQALAVKADHIDSELSLARLDEQQGDTVSAKKRYLSILDKTPSSVAIMTSLAKLAEKQGDAEGQIKWLQAARGADKKELYSRVVLIEILLEADNIAEAETIVKELESEHSNTPAFLAVKSRFLMAKKLYAQAEVTISEYIDAMPNMDIGYYLQAQNQLALGDERSALASSRKAYSLKPDVLRNVLLLASVEQSNGNYDRSMKLAEDIIKAAPDSAVGYALKGDALLATKNSKQALTNFDKAWSLTESRDIALRQFKATKILSGVGSAAPILTNWLAKHPDDAGVISTLAMAYFIDKQNSNAAIYFDKVLVIQPDNIIALNNLAWLYHLKNDPRALDLAKKAYILKPESPGIIDTYGWILLNSNKPAEALTLLKQAADKLPASPEVQYHYAKALYINGEAAAARKILKPIMASGKAFEGRNDAEKLLAQ